MINKIFVPTDFSETAHKALRYAIDIAGKCQSEIMVVHSYEVPHYGASVMVRVDDLVKQDAEDDMNKLETEIRAEFPELTFKFHCESGEFANTINHLVGVVKPDLCVMGTNGATGMKGVFFGSNASNLIQSIEIPILAVPGNTNVSELRRIAVATDLKFEKNDTVYNIVKRLASTYGAGVSFVSVSSCTSQEQIDTMEAEFGMEVDFVCNKSVESGIEDYLSVNDVDMLVMVAESHSIFEKVFNPSISKQLTKKLDIPMLILHK
jgi:nucleotide-binding universal stress UspA family protein